MFDTAISNLGERNFEYVALPFTDSTTLMAWELEYGFTDSGRWGWMRQLYGHIFSAKRSDYCIQHDCVWRIPATLAPCR